MMQVSRPEADKGIQDYAVNYLMIIAGLIVIFMTQYLPVPEGMGDKGLTTIAILLFAIFLWITDLIPAAVTGMVVIVCFTSFKILSFEEAAGTLGNEINWLLITMFIMSYAVEKTLLPKRLAFKFFLLAKGNLKANILLIILFCFFLSFLIPNIIGKIMFLIPICVEMIHSLEKQGMKNMGRIIFPAVTFISVIGAFSVMTGCGAILYAVNLFEISLGYKWNYLNWIMAMAPIGLITIAVYWLILIVFFIPKDTISTGNSLILKGKDVSESWTKQEKIISLLYVVLLGLWITKDIHKLSLAASSTLVVTLLFLPGIKIIEWKETIRNIDWSILFILVAGFGITKAFDNTGVITWLSSVTKTYVGYSSAFFVSLTLLIILSLIRIGFINYAMMIAVFLPVVFSLAGITSINPVWLALLSVVGCSNSFFLPAQTMEGMTTYSLGYHSLKEHIVQGTIITLIVIIVSLACAFFYWPLLGIGVYV